jgi:hypothetical protein
MQVRSGLNEGIDVAVGLRRAADPMELHDWLAQDFIPLNEAWSAVQVVGSPDAVRAATALLDACADLLGVATQPGEARGKMATALKGLAWTAQQADALDEARGVVVGARTAFIRIARAELGSEVVNASAERSADVAELLPADRQESRTGTPDHGG